MVPALLEIEEVDGEVQLAITENTIDVDGVPVDTDKAADAVRRCVTAIQIIRSYEASIHSDEMQVEMKALIAELTATLTGEPDAETDTN